MARRLPGGLETWFLALCAIAVLAMYLISLNVPVYGDAYAYGYRSARWMSDNGLAFVPQGTSRGAQAMGHPALFFWLWALLMSMLGDTLAVARILPAMATLMALIGTYMLGKRLSGSRWGGFISASALLASPLFITQSLRPIPDSAMVACVAWSLYLYITGRYRSAAIVCFVGVIFREQAIFLAGAYFITELLRTGFRRPLRLLFFASPVLVIVITGFLNMAANGYFFFPTYMGENEAPLAGGWALTRFRFFAGHLLAEDFRWIPVTAALAAMTAGRVRDRLPVLPVLILLLPAIFHPPGRLVFLFAVIALTAWHIYRRGAFPSRTVSVMVMFPALLVLFHVFIVAVAMDPALDLFRYVIGAYPVILSGAVAILWRYLGPGAASILGCVFIAATASANVSMKHYLQPETSLACLRPLVEMDRVCAFAAERADSVIVADLTLEMMGNEALGYDIDTSRFRSIGEGHGPLSPGVEYAVIVSTYDGTMPVLEEVARSIPEGSTLEEEPVGTWRYGPWETRCHLILPRAGNHR